MAVMASCMNSSMRAPLSGGLNQRDRMKSESLARTSGSPIWRQVPEAPRPHSTGRRIHLLETPARASGASSSPTSARSSQKSRNAPIGRSWASARASMAPLMPPAEAPATMSTTTRRSTVRPMSRSRSK